MHSTPEAKAARRDRITGNSVLWFHVWAATVAGRFSRDNAGCGEKLLRGHTIP